MKTENNYIDELVQNSFSDNEPSSSDDALWSRIDNTLKYKRFFRFSLYNFNIYYSVAIFLIVSFAGYFLITNNPENKVPVNNCPEPPVSNVKDDNVNSLPQNDKTVKPTIVTDKQVSEKSKQNEPVKNTKTYTLPVVKETENNITSKENTESKNSKKIKIVKKQLIITDTLRKRDTVFVKKLVIPK